MIQANEIRIGNYIADIWTPNGLFKVTELRKDKIFYGNCFKAKYDDIRPIPLTEEILLKAGFEKDIESLFYRNSFIIAKTKTRWAFYHNGLTGGELARIDYIHELQNLIFALTGEEIKIEL